LTKNRSRKEILFQEAAKLFREKGYQAANLRELAKRVGIQGGSLYYHFSSKQELLFQLMNTIMDQMISGLSSELAASNDPLTQLRSFFRFHIRFTVCGSELVYISDDELRHLDAGNYQQIIAKRDNYQQLVEQLLQRGQQLGWQVEDYKLLSRIAIQMGTGVLGWYRQEGSLSIEEIAERYWQFFCRGLLPVSQGLMTE